MNRFLVFGLVGISGAITAGCPIYSHDDAECDDSSDCSWGMVCSSGGYCVTYSAYGGSSSFTTALPRGSGGSSGRGGGAAAIDSGVDAAGGTLANDGGAVTSAGGAGPAPGADAGSAGAVSNSGGTTVTGAAGGAGAVEIPLDASVVVPEAALDATVVVPIDSASDADLRVVYCAGPADCPTGQTCDSSGVCRVGDCAAYPCINQYVCSRADSGFTCTPADPSFCSADAQCADDSLCVDGVCTKRADLCSDQTQCPGGHVCVEGKCVTSCGSNAQCPTGFRCRTELGICDEAVRDCSKTNDCGDPALVCIQNACVSRCSARGACDEGAGMCVSNGCLPAQKTVHECEADGATTGCGTGRICLHHHCYVSCEAPNETACVGLSKFTECKKVTTPSGSHFVCGSAQNLGSECDPTAGVSCPVGKICIDGFCR